MFRCRGPLAAPLPRLVRRAFSNKAMYLGNCYRMYPMTVEDEVQAALAAPEHFIRGPITILTPSESRGRASFWRNLAAVAMAKRLRRASPKKHGRMSYRQISAALAEAG